MTQAKAGGFTKQMARNMFYGGSLFFILVFAALIFDSERKIPQRSNAEAITPADLLRHDGNADRAVVNNKLEVTGQILRLEDRIDTECHETIVFPTPAADAHLESQYEDQQNGGYGEE